MESIALIQSPYRFNLKLINKRKDWWRFYLEFNRNSEDLIIWELNQLKIFSYAFNYDKQDDNKSKLLIWLPKLYWKKTNREKLENKLIKVLNDVGCKTTIFGWELINEHDWLNSWKEFWTFEIIGLNFLVLPCWMDLPSKYKKKIVIKIDPGDAFGTGSHPSTSLCLEMMEKSFMRDKKTLDIGSGSGILSIAARKLRAKTIHMIDNDYLAINSTRENLVLNFGQLNSFQIYEGTFFEVKKKYNLKKYDFILCNIFASVIKSMIPDFYPILNLQGSVVLSGILSSQQEEIIKLLNLFNFKIDTVLSKKDWICIKAIK